MDKRLEELMRAQQARASASQAIQRASGRGGNPARSTFLVSDFRRRDDLPDTASLRRMSNSVALKLAEQGLRDPVSLQALPNRWWRVNVDAAEEGLLAEYGCAFVTRTLSTASLMEMGFEVDEGPYSAWETDEVSRAILHSHPGKFWDSKIVNRSSTEAQEGGLPQKGFDNAHRSEALLAALDRGEAIQVFSGPFDTEDGARYALDVRWDSQIE